MAESTPFLPARSGVSPLACVKKTRPNAVDFAARDIRNVTPTLSLTPLTEMTRLFRLTTLTSIMPCS